MQGSRTLHHLQGHYVDTNRRGLGCRDHAPSIIFMDEVDSIGSARSESGGGGGGDSEVQRTMLELLNQLDGFEATNKIKVSASPAWQSDRAIAAGAAQSAGWI